MKDLFCCIVSLYSRDFRVHKGEMVLVYIPFNSLVVDILLNPLVKLRFDIL